MGVALRRPDRKPGRGGDLGEADVEEVLQRDDLRLGAAGARRGSARARAGSRRRAARRPGRRRRRGRSSASSGSVRRAARAWATSLQVLTTRRWSQVENCGLAAELPDAHDELRERLLRGVAGILGISEQVAARAARPAAAWRSQSAASARWSPAFARVDEDRVGEPLVAKRAVVARPHVGLDGQLGRGVARRAYSSGRWHSHPTLVLPAPARELRAAATSTRVETDSTQRMAPAGRRRTAPSRSPSTRPRGAGGSAGSGSTSPAQGSRSRSSCARRRPLARWPEITLLAAHAVAGAIGQAATRQGPQRRPARRPQGRRHARRGKRPCRARDRRQRRLGALAGRRASSRATASSCSSRSSSGSSAATSRGSAPRAP